MREKGDQWMGENPVGTGPYKLVKWNRKQEHLLVRNDDYWGPKPYYKYLRIRIIPEKATEIAELLSGGVDPDQGGAAGPDGRHRQVGRGADGFLAHPAHRHAPARPGRAGRAESLHGSEGPPGRQPRRDHDGIIKHVLNGLGDRVATGINPMAFGWDPTLKPYKQDLAAAKKLLAEAGYPNGVDIIFHEGPPIVEPAIQQTNDAIVADMAKAGFRVKRVYIGDNTVLVARIKEGKGGPMFNWSWGYYSVFDADAILYDVFKCGESYSYYCNKELDDLIATGRSSLDAKKRAEIYVKAQKLLYDDAAYLYKWGLRGVWGISNRIDYTAPADEVDRLFLATPRKK